MFKVEACSCNCAEERESYYGQFIIGKRRMHWVSVPMLKEIDAMLAFFIQ
jgi:hypothetical protein